MAAASIRAVGFWGNPGLESIMPSNVSLIIPALNEAECIGPLLAEIPPGVVQEVIVVDNGSTDGTGDAARVGGAIVVEEPRRGYGYACAAGVAAATGDIVAFMDGDGSFVAGELTNILALIENQQADLALGSRLLIKLPPEVMPPHQLFGNQLVSRLLNRMYGLHLTDLGPFRAIRRSLLSSLDMQEQTYGWPVEMMVKVARRRMRIMETAVSYRPRMAGKSKVGGTVRGTLLTAFRIFRVLFRHAFFLVKPQS
jgi:glycosyltransferase involved in cell wall biosynthesis